MFTLRQALQTDWCSLRLGLVSVVTLFAAFTVDAADQQSAQMPGKHLALFKQHCFECHDTKTKEGSVDLESLSFSISQDIATAERWQKVLGAINSGEMPPEDAKQISNADKSSFLKDLSEQMVAARNILSDTGGVITLRRLNRREYSNTIHSLLGVRPDVSNLPNDQSTGFDTQGASLFMSSDQIEQYLAAARRSLELSLFPQKKLDQKTVRVEPEREYTPHYAEAVAMLQDREKRAAAYFAQEEKPPSEFGFLDEYQVQKQKVSEWLPLLEGYLARPETKTGVTLIMTIKQGGYTKVKLPPLASTAPGKYIVRVRAGAYPDATERLSYLEFSTGTFSGRQRLGWRKVTGSLDSPEIIEFPIVHPPGSKEQIWIHQRSHQDRADKNLATIHRKENGVGTPPGLWIDWAELVGPIADDKSDTIRQRILFDKPNDWTEKQYAREVLRRFATRAFRVAAPDKGLLDRLVGHYDSNRAKGLKPIESLVGPLSIVLSSPSFLYMVESTGNDDSESLTGPELATRLAYFLWSSPADDQLMELARAGKLADPAVLKSQTSRLLADERADEFVERFVHQWLQMDRLGMFQFDGVQFQDFDNSVRENAREEIFQTVRYLIDHQLPLKNLLKSDFVVINDLLAGYYGIAGVKGPEFRKVPVPKDSLRGGLLGTVAIHAMGSDGQRSSPVERGAWVLRHLLNDPPPPAPPNVPQLGRLSDKALSARELATAHQEQPQCANCHQKIDAIGFGLENFTPAGLWRDQETVTTRGRFGKRKVETQFQIDPSGQLPDGTKFDGYLELRDAVALKTDDFAKGFTEALISYGLGRPFGFTDQELRDQIIDQTRVSDYDVSQFIHALIQSNTFKTK